MIIVVSYYIINAIGIFCVSIDLGIIYYIIAVAARIVLNDIWPMFVWLPSIFIAAAAGIFNDL